MRIDKRVKKLVKSLEAQGWRIETRKKGIMAFPPDKTKSPVTIHLTNSDHRWYANTIALLRRSGFIE
ncbi:hypothetical protein [Brevibacterium gallinarum]|uniref:Type II toxin-antitoxin system HicA family toxin n=1 Tax=Brevibacterium gallinarum TaxID=2762220 RepID=A0ABR8WQW8_9MICO|nr:hypothetical protein [Brevibacterium gallinarum]MBD8019404.1 hypothetical protein [Brevibacterium gallinarum]